MTAQAFIAVAQNCLSKFQHSLGCNGEPEVISHPVTGQIGIACRDCKRLIVITTVDKNPVFQEDKEKPEPKANPRFKL